MFWTFTSAPSWSRSSQHQIIETLPLCAVESPPSGQGYLRRRNSIETAIFRSFVRWTRMVNDIRIRIALEQKFHLHHG